MQNGKVEGEGACKVERESPANRETSGATQRSSSRGALLGLVVAEAFGAAQDATRRTKAGETGPWVEMALALATSLKDHGRFFAADLTPRYVALAATQKGLDTITVASLAMIARGVSIGEASNRAFVHENRAPLGDGGLARIAPIGIALADKPLQRRLAALAECAITHYEPRCRIAAAAFCAAIAEASRGNAEPAAMLNAARDEVVAACSALTDLVPRDGPEAEIARADLLSALDPAQDPKRFVPGVFPLIFQALLSAPTLEAGLRETALPGGDAGAGAAALGALLGARFGENAFGLPLLEQVFGDEAESRSRELLTLADGLRPSLK